MRSAAPARPAGVVSAHDKLKVYALGGLEEIGRNCMVFEMGEDIVIVDMGLMFPEEDMPGIDYIIPNVESLRGKERNIRGLIITHGHYDHIGGIPHLMDKLGNPIIYTAPLTAGIIRKRQEEYKGTPKLRIVMVQDAEQKFPLGKNFVFEPFHVNHNIWDSFGAAVHTPFGMLVHTGDFKFDYTPVDDEPADLNRIATYGSRGVLALFADSTDAAIPGHQISERVVGEELDRIFGRAQGRMILGTFSSLLTRVQQILALAEKYGRRVLVQGRSMQKMIEIAHELGYMKYKPGIFIEEHEFHKVPDKEIVVVGTGAQGEENAVLMRIANNEHRFIQIKPGDTVIFSSSVIPGNERTVQTLKDAMVKQGAKIIHYANMDIHAGGHAKQEDLKLLMRLTKPKYFVPIHGNPFMRYEHADLAESVGIARPHIFVPDNGQVIEFDKDGARVTDEKVMTDYVMVDGLGVGDVSQVILRERRTLAEDGMFVVIVTLEKRTGRIVGNPDIVSRGFVYMRDQRELIEKARARVKKLLRDSDPRSSAFEDYIKAKIRNDIGEFLYQQIRRRPMVLPVLVEV